MRGNREQRTANRAAAATPGSRRRDALLLALTTLLGLGLRLLVWHWRELQPLGGDEQEYLNAAVTLLRDRQYTELLFMRPPLYPLFLAGSILVVDSLVQNLRLVQALISAATIPFVYLLTLEVAWGAGRHGPASRRVALLGALLAALSYTLAANAAELLTETLFLFGLTIVLWLVLRAGRTGRWQTAALAGLGIGALCLVRSVALPLLPLGALWLALSAWRSRQGAQRSFAPALALIACTLLVVLPWTARNYLAYGGLILIDTTGAENLWLDNDPAGREAVKAQLYALGDDRLLRQQLGARNGMAAILNDPGRFAAKAWGELLKFFALEYADDMRARPAIWVRPADIWLRLGLGDALWLTVLLAGSYGLVRGARSISGPSALLAPWALYVLLTTLLFHVELRYRLPLFPSLLPFAALTLLGGFSSAPRRRSIAALAAPTACLVLTLLHTNYLTLGWQLGWKHWHLAEAQRALSRGYVLGALVEGDAALRRDPGSALARVALARAALLDGNAERALALLDAAVAAIPDHPLAHAVRGDLRRIQGDTQGAAPDLAYEAATQQDLQQWGWDWFVTPPPTRLELGDGLDLGFIRGFHLQREGDEGFRWTRARSELRLAVPPDAHELLLRIGSGRPDGSPAHVTIAVDGAPAGTFSVGADWQELRLPLSVASSERDAIVVELRAPTFLPRQFDRASPDGRALGVMLDWAEVR